MVNDVVDSLCTLDEDDEMFWDDEVFSDDGSMQGPNLQLVCKEFGVGASINGLEDSRDEPSPIYYLPPVPLWGFTFGLGSS